MIELLYSTGSTFLVFLFLFFFIPIIKIFKLLILLVQLIFSIYLVFYNKNKSIVIQETLFDPIKNFKIYFKNEIYNDVFYSNKEFSFFKYDNYTKQCLFNYYIKYDEECPITDIIVEKEKKNSYIGYSEYIISYNYNPYLYLYYTNNKLDGQLYSSISIIETSCSNAEAFQISNYCYSLYLKKEPFFVDDSIIISLKNALSLQNELDDYSNKSNKVCFILLLICFIYAIYEPYNSKICNYFKVISWIIYIFPSLFFLLRFLKFVKIKHLVVTNQEGIINKYIRKYFNFESFPISFSIALELIYILYLITPLKIHTCNKFFSSNECIQRKYPKFITSFYNEKTEIKLRFFLLLSPIYVCFLIFQIYDFVNESKINKNYDIIFSDNQMDLLSKQYSNKVTFQNYGSYYNISDNRTIIGNKNENNNLNFRRIEEYMIKNADKLILKTKKEQFKRFLVFKYILLFLNFFVIGYFFFLFFQTNEVANFHLAIAFLFLVVMIIYIIIYSISLKFNLNYVKNI